MTNILSFKQTANNPANLQSPSFDTVIKEMEDWRSQRPKNSKACIPDQLWHKIFHLAAHYKPSRVRNALGISSKQYQKKFAQLHALDPDPCSDDDHDQSPAFCEVTTNNIHPQPMPKSQSQSDPKQDDTSSEISQIPATNTMLVEFRRKDDEVMIIHATTNHLQDMIRAFFNGDI